MVAQGWASPPGGVDYRTAITEAGESTVTTFPTDTADLTTPSAATLEVDRSGTEISPPADSRFQKQKLEVQELPVRTNFLPTITQINRL